MLSTSYSLTDIDQIAVNGYAADALKPLSAILNELDTLRYQHCGASCGSPVAADAFESGAFSSFAPLEPTAATTSEQLGEEIVGLDGKPLRVTVFQPQSFSELSPDMEEHFTKRICKLGELIQSIGNDQEKYRQAIDMWKSIYGNVLTHIGACDTYHRYSDKFFKYFDIFADRMNTTVKPYEPCVGKHDKSDASKAWYDSSFGTNANYLHTTRYFHKYQGRAHIYVYDSTTHKTNTVWLSICQVMTKIFPLAGTLEQDDLSATAPLQNNLN